MDRQHIERVPIKTGLVLVAPPGEAMPPEFEDAVILIIGSHEDMGVTGLILNRPFTPEDAVHYGGTSDLIWRNTPAGLTLLRGGPDGIGDMAVFMHNGLDDQGNARLVFLPANSDNFEHKAARFAGERGRALLAVATGFTHWAPGLLEDQIAAEGWLTLPYCPDLLFRTPHAKMHDAAVRVHDLIRRAGASLTTAAAPAPRSPAGGPS